MNAEEMAREGRRLSQLLDDGLSYMKRMVNEAATTESAYRQAKARAWMEVPAGTVPQKEAWVEGVTAELRMKRDIADGMRRAALEAIRSRQQQISLLQSVASAYRAEAQVGQYGMEMTP